MKRLNLRDRAHLHKPRIQRGPGEIKPWRSYRNWREVWIFSNAGIGRVRHFYPDLKPRRRVSTDSLMLPGRLQLGHVHRSYIL